jgi:trehalose-6-phosphate synthase
MPILERRQRHAEMYKLLCDNDIDHWAARFLDVLKKPAVAVELPPRFRVV